MSAVRLGIVGCGRLAEIGYLPAIASTAGVELATVADPVRERRERLAALAGDCGAASAAGTATEPTAERLVARGGLDAVVVASPVETHVEHAGVAAAAGLPSLVEKPPAPGAAGAEELVRLDPAPRVGFNRRFQQGAALAPRIPAEGSLELELELRYRRRSWRPHRATGDAWLDLGPHLVDLVLFLTGAREAEVKEARLERDRAVVELRTPRGPARLACATDRAHRERVVARGEDGVVARTDTGGAARGVIDRLARTEHPLAASLRAQLVAFAAMVRGRGAGSLASASDGARVMRTLDRARELAGGCS
jgi:predicted dehydrogenase